MRHQINGCLQKPKDQREETDIGKVCEKWTKERKVIEKETRMVASVRREARVVVQ